MRGLCTVTSWRVERDAWSLNAKEDSPRGTSPGAVSYRFFTRNAERVTRNAYGT